MVFPYLRGGVPGLANPLYSPVTTTIIITIAAIATIATSPGRHWSGSRQPSCRYVAGALNSRSYRNTLTNAAIALRTATAPLQMDAFLFSREASINTMADIIPPDARVQNMKRLVVSDRCRNFC
jgi:hypothetical protein